MNELEKFDRWATDNLGSRDYLNIAELKLSFEKSKELKYFVRYDDDLESYDVINRENDEEITIFYLSDVKDAKDRARALCDELNQKDKIIHGLQDQLSCYPESAISLKTIPEKFPGITGKLLENHAEKELDKIMPNLPPRCGKFKLLIIDDPSRDIESMELKAKRIARDIAIKCGLRLPKDY